MAFQDSVLLIRKSFDSVEFLNAVGDGWSFGIESVTKKSALFTAIYRSGLLCEVILNS